MSLDPQAKTYLDQLAALNLPDAPDMTPKEARAQMELSAVMLGRPPAVARVEDRTLPGPAGPIRVRMTVPEGAGEGPKPALVYLHGGGWVVGSLGSHDHLCRSITAFSGVSVISVDYRLAPEHPFPAAVDDAQAAMEYVAEHAAEFDVDPARLAIGGDSAGGNIAAAVARRLRDKGSSRLAFQLLIYPATDADMNTASYLENAEGYLLTRAAMAWYWDQYVPDEAQRLDPDASPLRAADLSGLPPTLILTAGYDPLRDEAEAYGHKLGEAGVPVTLSRYSGMFHGFLRRHAQLAQGKAALTQIAEALRKALLAS
jgi:acetyl esterase